MLLGPIRYQYTSKDRAKEQGGAHLVYPRFTRAVVPGFGQDNMHPNDVYEIVRYNEDRDDLIVSDVKQCIADGRTPVAGKNVVEQYAGRLNRDYEGKKNVIIYDYVDSHIPMFDRMYGKRLKAYKWIGHEIYSENDTEKQEAGLRIVIVTWMPDQYGYGESEYWMELQERMRRSGFEMNLVEDYCEHYCIVDREIVWDGSMNFLGKEDAEDNLMRVDSRAIAAELLELTFGRGGDDGEGMY